MAFEWSAPDDQCGRFHDLLAEDVAVVVAVFTGQTKSGSNLIKMEINWPPGAATDCTSSPSCGCCAPQNAFRISGGRKSSGRSTDSNHQTGKFYLCGCQVWNALFTDRIKGSVSEVWAIWNFNWKEKASCECRCFINVSDGSWNTMEFNLMDC